MSLVVAGVVALSSKNLPKAGAGCQLVTTSGAPLAHMLQPRGAFPICQA